MATNTPSSTSSTCAQMGTRSTPPTCAVRQEAHPGLADQLVHPPPAEVIERLQQVPETVNDLDGYYEHLLNSLTSGGPGIGALAICDFALSKEELGEVIPAFEPLLDGALATLAPVLVSLPGAGGLKVHHEKLTGLSAATNPDLGPTTSGKAQPTGSEPAAYSAIPEHFGTPQLLADLGHYDELKAIVDRQFVTNAVAQLQPPEAIKHVLATVATEAQNRGDWKTLITCVEAFPRRERLRTRIPPETLVEYADVVVRILGATLSPNASSTKAVRRSQPAGALASAKQSTWWCARPVGPYLAARKREAETDNTDYGPVSDGRLHLAEQLGYLRLRPHAAGTLDVAKLANHLDEHRGRPPLGDLVEVFANAIDADDLLFSRPRHVVRGERRHRVHHAR